MKKIDKIAKDILRIETLEIRNRDRLDFHEVAVWNVKEALEKAYNLGKKDKSPKNKELIKRIENWCKDFDELSNHMIGDETLEDEAYWIFQEVIKQ